MVTTADDELAARVRLLRSHGMTSVTWDRHRGHAESYDIVDFGFNFRIDEPRAALALSRLPRLEADLEARRTAVRAYRERLAELEPELEREDVIVPWDDGAVERSSHFTVPIVMRDRATRDAVRAGLARRGVQTTWYPSISTFTEYAVGVARPRAEDAADRHIALPLSSHTAEGDVDIVIGALRGALAEAA